MRRTTLVKRLVAALTKHQLRHERSGNWHGLYHSDFVRALVGLGCAWGSLRMRQHFSSASLGKDLAQVRGTAGVRRPSTLTCCLSLLACLVLFAACTTLGRGSAESTSGATLNTEGMLWQKPLYQTIRNAADVDGNVDSRVRDRVFLEAMTNDRSMVHKRTESSAG